MDILLPTIISISDRRYRCYLDTPPDDERNARHGKDLDSRSRTRRAPQTCDDKEREEETKCILTLDSDDDVETLGNDMTNLDLAQEPDMPDAPEKVYFGSRSHHLAADGAAMLQQSINVESNHLPKGEIKRQANYKTVRVLPQQSENKPLPESTRLISTIIVPKAFQSKVCGTNMAVKKRLEHDTNCSITIPKRESPSEEIIIMGETLQAMDSCKTRIEIIVDTAMETAPITHFLSIPLNIEPCISRLQVFSEHTTSLSNEGALEGFTPVMVQSASSLHLTIGVLKLYGQDRIMAAKEFLQTIQKDLQTTFFPLSIAVKGIEYMNDDPGAVDVLYAKLAAHDPPVDRLQKLANFLVKRFCDAGFMSPTSFGTDGLSVKLHATLINSKHGMRVGKFGHAERKTFDARTLLDHCSMFDFGVVPVHAIHLSKMKSSTKTKYYEAEHIIKMA